MDYFNLFYESHFLTYSKPVISDASKQPIFFGWFNLLVFTVQVRKRTRLLVSNCAGQMFIWYGVQTQNRTTFNTDSFQSSVYHIT